MCMASLSYIQKICSSQFWSPHSLLGNVCVCVQECFQFYVISTFLKFHSIYNGSLVKIVLFRFSAMIYNQEKQSTSELNKLQIISLLPKTNPFSSYKGPCWHQINQQIPVALLRFLCQTHLQFPSEKPKYLPRSYLNSRKID